MINFSVKAFTISFSIMLLYLSVICSIYEDINIHGSYKRLEMKLRSKKFSRYYVICIVTFLSEPSSSYRLEVSYPNPYHTPNQIPDPMVSKRTLTTDRIH